MTIAKRFWMLGAALALSVTSASAQQASSPGARAAAEFPNKPVTIVVASSAGGAIDTLGRFLADTLSKHWKQTVVVENRPGAGGSIATNYVAKSKPDGYTMVIQANTYTTTAAVQRNLPFDSVKDVQPISMVARGQMVIMTGNRVPMPTLAELIKQAKSQKIFYGASGVGSAPVFATELLGSIAGVKFESVNYKGATEAMIDMVGGRLDLYIASVTNMLPYITAKTAVPVAIMGDRRAPAIPDVPTVAEAGHPTALFELWYGILAPAGTPPEVAEKINEAIKVVTNSPAGIEFLAKNGAAPTDMKVDAFTQRVASEITQWKDLAQKLNLFEN